MESKSQSPYKKLCGGSSTSAQSSYLGESHLVILDGRYRESVRQISYEDIEATLICPTNTGKYIGLIAGLGGLLFSVITLFQMIEGYGGLWVFLGIAVALWIIFGANLYNKGTASLGVLTAVQTVIIEGATNLRKARKIESRIADRVQAIQGKLTEEDLTEAFARRQDQQSRSYRPPPIPDTTSTTAPIGVSNIQDNGGAQ